MKRPELARWLSKRRSEIEVALFTSKSPLHTEFLKGEYAIIDEIQMRGTGDLTDEKRVKRIYTFTPKLYKMFITRNGRPPICHTCNQPILLDAKVVRSHTGRSPAVLRHISCARQVHVI